MFVALVLISGSIQWCFMIMGAIFSLGFLHSSEEERILPFTDEEFKKRKIIRVNMIWLRYLIFGLIAYAVNYVMILKDVSVWDIGFAPMTYALSERRSN